MLYLVCGNLTANCTARFNSEYAPNARRIAIQSSNGQAIHSSGDGRSATLGGPRKRVRLVIGNAFAIGVHDGEHVSRPDRRTYFAPVLREHARTIYKDLILPRTMTQPCNRIARFHPTPRGSKPLDKNSRLPGWGGTRSGTGTSYQNGIGVAGNQLVIMPSKMLPQPAPQRRRD